MTPLDAGRGDGFEEMPAESPDCRPDGARTEDRPEDGAESASGADHGAAGLPGGRPTSEPSPSRPWWVPKSRPPVPDDWRPDPAINSVREIARRKLSQLAEEQKTAEGRRRDADMGIEHRPRERWEVIAGAPGCEVCGAPVLWTGARYVTEHDAEKHGGASCESSASKRARAEPAMPSPASREQLERELRRMRPRRDLDEMDDE